MTTDEKRIKIAEACGWQDLGLDAEHVRWWAPKSFVAVMNAIGWIEFSKHRRTIYGLPDYFNDLNACHEMEMTLSYEDWCTFKIILSDVVRANQHLKWITPYNYVSATASQRAEAFGKTLNLW